MSFTFDGYIIHNPSKDLGHIVAKNNLHASVHKSVNCLIIQRHKNSSFDIIEKIISDKMLYLKYITWAGLLDQCDGYIVEGGKIIAATVIENDTDDFEINEKSFKKLMENLGLELDGTYFTPFDRRHDEYIK